MKLAERGERHENPLSCRRHYGGGQDDGLQEAESPATQQRILGRRLVLGYAPLSNHGRDQGDGTGQHLPSAV